MLSYLQKIWKTKTLRQKILFTVGMILVYRLVAHITVPGIDANALKLVFDQNSLLGIFAAFTGGTMDNFSVALMGLSPYINASIIIQLMTVVIPKLETLSKEGEQGRRVLNRYTRYLTIPLALLQSYGMIILLNNSAGSITGAGLVPNITDPTVIIPMMLTITAGTLLIMWIGELITENGIGNGISMIIFVGILSAVPGIVGQTLGLAKFDDSRYLPFMILMIITLLLTILVIIVTEGQRNIPITYSGRQVGTVSQKSNLPIRVNQAGMIPIIFAISLTTFPAIIAQFFQGNPVADWIIQNLGGAGSFSPWYIGSLFVLVIAFTFFYVSITFNPVQVAEDIQKRGGFVVGIRPGKQTADFLNAVSLRLNLWGGLFIGFLAAFPLLLQSWFQSFGLGSVQLLLSGSGLIIVVGVVIELFRQINAQLVMHDYDKMY
jgi:preprotein translocase subunit SecY